MGLPVERILWAPTNSAHHNHLHVVGDPRFAQHQLPTNGVWTPAINAIVDALDAHFGPGEHFIIDPDAAWTHMGVYNPRYIGGTTTWSQHAGANAIDIGPYYGVEEQQEFYDFLLREEDTMTLTPEEQAFVKQAYRATVVERGSNGTALGYAVDHLRDHPSGGDGTDQKARNEAKRANDRLDSAKNAL